MKTGDVIVFAEGAFHCSMGAPWRWADLIMTKPYQRIEQEGSDEHMLASKMINALTRLKQDAGFNYQQRPRLWWRWDQKVRFDGTSMVTRLYLDGSPPYQHTNPQRPNGRPVVGQMRLVAA